jgi:hypothetical protein
MANYTDRMSEIPWFAHLTEEELCLISTLETRALGRFHEEEAKKSFKAVRDVLGSNSRIALTIGTLDKKETRKTKGAKGNELSGESRLEEPPLEEIPRVEPIESASEDSSMKEPRVEFSIFPSEPGRTKKQVTKRTNAEVLFRKTPAKKPYQGPGGHPHSEDPNLFTTK